MHRLVSLLLLALVVPSGVGAGEFVLVEKGTAPTPIVIFKGAPPRTRAAAEVLADYVARISGRKPAVLEGEPSPIPERAIWVGYQPALRALFPKTDFEFKQAEEIVIVAGEKHLVIAGRDRWDPAHLDFRNREGVVKGRQQEYGTINAVYTFLQEQLGVRWFWPGELGEDVPKRERLAVAAPYELRYHPRIRSRGGIFNGSTLENIRGYGQSQEWTMRQRLQLDSLRMEGGHGFGTWWERYHEKYPEIFALQPDGTRSGFPNPRTAKLCMSNPKVWELWLEDVAAALEQDPSRTLFNASPNDGWSSGHCICAKCSAWDDPAGEPRVFNWFHANETRPATSDRDVTFANLLGEMLEKRYPGKGYRVFMLSYGHSRPVPIHARPSERVLMSVVANFFGRPGLVDRGSTRGDTYRQQLEGWTKIVPSFLWRPNSGSPAGFQQGLPDLHVTQTIADLKAVAAGHCEGIFIDTIGEHWATQGPLYYILAQLAWNPGADAAAIMDDYYARGFGPAAPQVREYYESLEKARMAFTAKNMEAEVYSFPQLYTPELLGASQRRLEHAAAAVPAGSLEAKRVAFVRAGLTYTTLQIQNLTLMAGYWKAPDPTVAGQVKANWQTIEKLTADNPYALNWGPIRPTTPRMLGFHPEAGKPKLKQKAKVNDLDGQAERSPKPPQAAP